MKFIIKHNRTMKVDSFINSADEMVLLNERQAQKIKFLEAEKMRN